MLAADAASTETKGPDLAGLAISLASGLGLLGLALFLAIMPWSMRTVGARDFSIYWATGQQLIHHRNPFDPAAMGRLEHQAGYPVHQAVYMRNPPWGLPLALPLGLFSSQAASLPWSLLMLGLLGLSVWLLWRAIGILGRRLDLLGYAFPPALICVMMGQTSLFVLLGLTLFLCCHRTRPFAAGAALWFCTLKPHLFLAFGLVLLVWIVVNRSWRILLGALTALAASCALTTWIDPHAWAEYLHWARTSGISHEFIPCLGVVLRTLVNTESSWIAFLPALPLCVWSLLWFWPRRHSWNWFDHGGLLMLVSIIAAPYHWIYDESLALPALLFALSRTRSRPLLVILCCLYLAIEIQLVAIKGLDSVWYLWPEVAWLLWYLFARATASESLSANASPALPATAGSLA